MEELVKINNLVKRYGSNNVLNKLNLTVNKGEFISIIGKSGCGKSTLLNIIGLLDKFESGNYFFKGTDTSKGVGIKTRIRAYDIGFIFQSYCLLDNLSVMDNVLMPLFYNEMKIDKDIKYIAEMYLETFGLSELKYTKTKYLSGGEKQRVAIVRAIVKNPEMIVADEPTGNLDPENSTLICNELGKLTEMGKTIVVVTHNLEVFKNVDRKYRLEAGRLIDE